MMRATAVGSVTFAVAADPTHAMFGLFAMAPSVNGTGFRLERQSPFGVTEKLRGNDY